MKPFWIILLLFPFFLPAGCTEDPPPSLNSKDRELIDSLYRLEIQVLKPQLDSLCEHHFDRRIQEAVDSIWAIRLAEINKQLERIRNQNQNF